MIRPPSSAPGTSSPTAETASRKQRGAWYTDPALARLLVGWAARRSEDRILDPSCGDGVFLVAHPYATGVESDPQAVASAGLRAPHARVIESDFFRFAASTEERFDVACGNPPFIRFQRFTGEIRARAAALCEEMGVRISGLTSSWVPFLVAASRCVRQGGRMAFVVPAEIGHAPYAAPLLRHLARSFGEVRVVAVRERLFPSTSEDCWLLLCDRRGDRADSLRLAVIDRASGEASLRGRSARIPLADWETHSERLRPFLLPDAIRALYVARAGDPDTVRLGECAQVGIGYVTGDNRFFHLRPSQASALGISSESLHPAVRNGRSLRGDAVTADVVAEWREDDAAYLLLRLAPATEPPLAVQVYLDSDRGMRARAAFKCRIRDPWWSVPWVRVPDGFLTSLNGTAPRIVSNPAGCAATNSVHIVHCRPGVSIDALRRAFSSTMAQLSCELEGHPLGGGMLKLEPKEAQRVVLPAILPAARSGDREDEALFAEGIAVMRRWRRVKGVDI